MTPPPASRVRTWITAVVALAAMGVTYGLSRLPVLPAEEAAALAGRFRFTRAAAPELANHPPYRQVRPVHPSLTRISAWISSLGAAVALGDLDGDGLPNDMIHVDPRTDLVLVAPVPGTGARHRAASLNPSPLPFDGSKMAPMGSLVGDFNEDGFRDILVYYWGRTPVIFVAVPPGSEGPPPPEQPLAYRPQELVTTGERWYTNGATLADLDGDGHVDLLIGNYFQDGAHVLDETAGGIEVLHEGKAKALNGGLKHVFLWSGSGSAGGSGFGFREITGVFDESVNRGWTLAIGAADLDGDLLPELYFGHDFGPDRLLHNRSRPGHLEFVELHGRRTFTTPKSCVIGNDSFKGMGCDFGDMNGDGIMDIYVSNIATRFGLTESHFLWESTGETALMKQGIAPYRQASERLGLSRSGWGWESRLADFDNDGVLEAIQGCGFLKGTINRWPELQALGTSNDQMVHNPKFWPNFKPGADLSGHDWNPFFVRSSSGRYFDLSPALGLNEPMVTKGIATADVDGDGRLDFAVANQWGPSYFFHNDAPAPGAFLGLHVVLPVEPLPAGPLRVLPGHPPRNSRVRAAIGAVARVTLPGNVLRVGQVDGGAGHSGRRSPEIHLGLGGVDAKTPVPVELRWRDRDGTPRDSQLRLVPGWHTIVLGSQEQPAAANIAPARGL